MTTAWERKAPDHWVTQNDTGTTIYDQLLDRNGTAVVLTGATVQYQARFPGAVALKVDAAATVEAALTGQVSYRYLAANADTAGELLEIWRVTYSNGQIQRFPVIGPHKVRIAEDIA